MQSHPEYGDVVMKLSSILLRLEKLDEALIACKEVFLKSVASHPHPNCQGKSARAVYTSFLIPFCSLHESPNPPAIYTSHCILLEACRTSNPYRPKPQPEFQARHVFETNPGCTQQYAVP